MNFTKYLKIIVISIAIFSFRKNYSCIALNQSQICIIDEKINRLIAQNQQSFYSALKLIPATKLSEALVFTIKNNKFFKPNELSSEEEKIIFFWLLSGLFTIISNNLISQNQNAFNTVVDISFYSKASLNLMNLIYHQLIKSNPKKIRNFHKQISQIIKNTKCPICLEVCEKPIMPCLNSNKHIFCFECINRWYKNNEKSGTSCPLCKNKLNLTLKSGMILSYDSIKNLNEKNLKQLIVTTCALCLCLFLMTSTLWNS